MGRISTNKSIPNRINSNVLKKMEAFGKGLLSFGGIVRIHTETETIDISWTKTGQPHICILPNGIKTLEGHDFFTIIDEQGGIHLEWGDEDKAPKPRVTTKTIEKPKRKYTKRSKKL